MPADWSQNLLQLFISKTEDEHYEPLRTSEETKEETGIGLRHGKKQSRSTRYGILLVLAYTMGCGAIGFALGSHTWNPTQGRVEDFLMTPGDINYPMLYNRTYSEEPSTKTDAAWHSMFPKGVGFVKHPVISPNLSGLAVFHELHCVNMLRVGYYAALNGNLAEMQHIHDHNNRPDPQHLRHCFDYLRQSLICTVDTNLEPVDFELGGVTGWKFERTCRNFEQVKEWAEEWRAWDPELQAPERH